MRYFRYLAPWLFRRLFGLYLCGAHTYALPILPVCLDLVWELAGRIVYVVLFLLPRRLYICAWVLGICPFVSPCVVSVPCFLPIRGLFVPCVLCFCIYGWSLCSLFAFLFPPPGLSQVISCSCLICDRIGSGVFLFVSFSCLVSLALSMCSLVSCLFFCICLLVLLHFLFQVGFVLSAVLLFFGIFRGARFLCLVSHMRLPPRLSCGVLGSVRGSVVHFAIGVVFLAWCILGVARMLLLCSGVCVSGDGIMLFLVFVSLFFLFGLCVVPILGVLLMPFLLRISRGCFYCDLVVVWFALQMW